MNDTLVLANDRISLKVAPHFGARVTSLTDLRTGRDWLVGGKLEGSAADEAVFSGAEARGWDECFPTVAPCDNDDWGSRLRDHGDIWGRPTTCTANDDEITSVFEGDHYSFKRILKLYGERLHIDYAVTNTSDKALPYMWSQHCLLATTPADRIFIHGIGDMNVSGTGGMSGNVPSTFKWPRLSESHPDMGVIEPSEAGWIFKGYAAGSREIEAGIEGPNGTIAFLSDSEQTPFLGLWLDYGGWPQSKPVHQIAIEPTTAAADDLSGALRNGQARGLLPGETHHWAVTIRLSTND